MDGRSAARSPVAAALLALALASPSGALPLEDAAPEAPPSAPDELTWIDAGQGFLARGFLWTVLRFDRIFADERDLDLPRTRSFVRWRNALTLREDGTRSYAPDLRTEATLPNLDRRLDRLRLRLTLETAGSEAVDPLLPPTVRPADVPNRPHAGLQLAPVRPSRTRADLQTGALLRRPLGWYARARIHRLEPFGDTMVGRLALVGFWQTDLGLGTRQDLSLERPLTPWLLLRLTGGSLVAERSRGWEWSSELTLLAASWPRTVLALSGAALGATSAGPGVEVWRVRARARHDVLRRWVFLEAAPECAWTRGAGGQLRRSTAVILLLELQFEASAGEPRPVVAGRPAGLERADEEGSPAKEHP